MSYSDLNLRISRYVILFIVFINLLIAIFEDQLTSAVEFDFSVIRISSIWMVLLLTVPQLYRAFDKIAELDKESEKQYNEIWIGSIYDRILAQKTTFPNTIFYVNDKKYLNISQLSRVAKKINVRVCIGRDALANLEPTDAHRLIKSLGGFHVFDSKQKGIFVKYIDEMNILRAVDMQIEKNKYFRIRIGKLSEKEVSIFENSGSHEFYIDNIVTFQFVKSVAISADELMFDIFNENPIRSLDRNRLFEIAAAVIGVAESSLKAVDFIPPRDWNNVPALIRYADAHGINVDEKVRIHIFPNENYIFDEKIEYEKYVKKMKGLKVDLRFLEEKRLLDLGHEARGSLVVDDRAIVVAVNPKVGAPTGEITIDRRYLEDYARRFNDIVEAAESWPELTARMNEEKRA